MLAYVDASVWIARIEGLPVYQNIIESCLDELKLDGWEFCISPAVIMETLYKPLRQKNHEIVNLYLEMFGSVKTLQNYENLFDKGFQIMKSDSLKTIDALHAAFAVYYGCDRLVTTDLDFQNIFSIPIYMIDLSN